MLTNLEHIPCPNCKSSQSKPWGQENGFTAVKCSYCGLVYVSPRPDLSSISCANKIGVHRIQEGALNVKAGRDTRKIRRYHKVITEMFAERIGQGEPVTWLDIGAGYGEVVEAATAALPPGSKVVGVEPMATKVAAAKKLGLPIEDTPLEQISGKYDVVSLINVFSHIPDFSSFGLQVRGLVRSGGELFIETGNGGDLGKREDYPDPLDLPDHLVFAGIEQMTDILGKLGFAVHATKQERIDGFLSTLKFTVKGVLRGKARFRRPNASPFRTVFYRARLRA